MHLTPERPEIHAELGTLWLAESHLAAAEAAFTVALSFVAGGDADQEADAWVGRARACFAQRSDPSEVEPMIRKALARRPDHEEARRLQEHVSAAGSAGR